MPQPEKPCGFASAVSAMEKAVVFRRSTGPNRLPVFAQFASEVKDVSG
jgi:hypothetical protein